MIEPDPAASIGRHDRRSGEQGGPDVGVPDVVELLDGERLGVLAHDDAGVVDEHVDAPAERSRAAATAEPGPSGVPRSAGTTTGSLARVAAVSSSWSAERATSATRAPAASRARAIAAPMPAPGPGDDGRATVEHRRSPDSVIVTELMTTS